MFGRHHLVFGEERGQGHIGALSSCGHRRVVGDVAVTNHQLRTIGGIGCLYVSQTTSHRNHVDGGITTPDTDQFVGSHLHPALVEGLEECHAADAVRRPFPAGYGKTTAALAPQRPQQGIELLLDFFNGDFPADTGLHPQLYTHVNDTLQFMVQLVAGNTVPGDAVAHHATKLLVLVEQGDRMPLASQLESCSHTCGATADNGYLFTGIRTGFEGKLLFDSQVPDVLFYRVDADEVFHIIAVAAILTRSRTDAAHHGRKGVGIG